MWRAGHCVLQRNNSGSRVSTRKRLAAKISPGAARVMMRLSRPARVHCARNAERRPRCRVRPRAAREAPAPRRKSWASDRRRALCKRCTAVQASAACSVRKTPCLLHEMRRDRHDDGMRTSGSVLARATHPSANPVSLPVQAATHQQTPPEPGRAKSLKPDKQVRDEGIVSCPYPRNVAPPLGIAHIKFV